MRARRLKNACFAGILLAAGLTACTPLFSEPMHILPIETGQTPANAQHDLLYEGAVSAINSRDYARALAYLQQARALDAKNVKALNALGVIYDKLGRFDLSARYYAQAHALDPASPVVTANIAYSKVLQGLLSPDSPVMSASAAPANPGNVPAGGPVMAELSAPASAARFENIAPISPVAANIRTTWHPVSIANASGSADVGIIGRRLTALGWRAGQSGTAPTQSATVLSFPPQKLSAARAMRRTLPFRVKLVPAGAGETGMRLVIGRDYLSWKPRRARLAALWQKTARVASLPPAAAKEVQ